MKKLLPLLLSAFTLSANAQNYELFPNPSDTLSFSDTEGNVIFIAFDSVNSSATQNVYWPHNETAITNNPSNSNCIGHIIDTAWFGYKIEQHSSSLYKFKHSQYEFSLDITSTNLSADSIGWVLINNQTYIIKSTFTSQSQQTLYNNNIDSVRSFEITVKDSSGYTYLPNRLIPLKFEVSKNYGLISIPILGDIYHSYSVAQKSRTLNRILPYKLITRKKMFDFEIGDIFHYRSYTSTVFGPSSPPKYTNNTVIAKTYVNSDSVIYTCEQKWKTYTIDYQTMTRINVSGTDTIVVSYGKLTELISDNLSFQSDTTSGPFSFTTSFWLNDTLGRPGISFIGDISYRQGNCIEIPFEPSPKENTYVTGIGLIYSYEINFPAISVKQLLYFKKATGQTWGSPYNISIEELAQRRPLKIYPNPASDVLNIELPDGVQQMEITIIDQVGRTLLKESITKEKSGISVEALSPGAYFIRTNKGSAVPFIKR
ncbi:T9SS type A sorting domain-containing protein [Owenweeksia hongkongensis]|uniref:T9SS type A sorting domain-containing protein n=1 Tax=Owenweeksia hongkongensis TaxID=253245 RepID=UPI003A918EE2